MIAGEMIPSKFFCDEFARNHFASVLPDVGGLEIGAPVLAVGGAGVFRPLLTVMEGSEHGLPPPLERALAAVDDELDKLLEGAIPMKKVA